MLRQSFGFHQGDVLHFSLEDEESVVVQVDALLPEHLGDLLVLDPPAVEGVVGAVVLVGGPRHAEPGIGHHLGLLAASVDDLLEMDGDPAPVLVGMSARVVWINTENKQHRVNDV